MYHFLTVTGVSHSLISRFKDTPCQPLQPPTNTRMPRDPIPSSGMHDETDSSKPDINNKLHKF